MNPSSRLGRIISEAQNVLEQVSGRELAGESPETSFYDLGLDSLLLTQAAQAVGKRFGVKLKLRHLAEEFPSCKLLADYLDQQLPPTAFADAPAAPAPAPAAVASAAVAAPAISAQPVALAPVAAIVAPALPRVADASDAAARPGLEGLVRQQIALMARQLEVLAGSAGRVASTAPAASATIAPVAVPAAAAATAQPAGASSAAAAANAAPAASADAAPDKPKAHGPQLVIDRSQGSALTPTQEKHIAKLIERYTARTRKSKEFTQRNRHQVADPRTVAGFRPKLKELVYPLVVQRSSGCRLWDLDDNEYIDLLSGYGSNFFGFGAPFIKQAIAEQLERGMEIGPQTVLVEEVATLFREFVPFDRVAFCNTGSEAVLATLRMARTATGRDLVVMFTGGYHGIFDEVVVRPTKQRSMPAAPGIPQSAVDNILVLPWAEQESLDIIRSRADEIAAVLCEPVQSRAPDVQPVEFLKELRRITEEAGTALIFDEVVCGFRVAPGGAQEYFGIQADLASYGKVVGGGISIGIIGGKREFMDALDGGHWQYGDASVPEVGVTYFAGTFVRHPVAMAAARAALLYMKAQGPELQRGVNAKAEKFANELNTFFKEQGAPLKVKQFCSVMKIGHTQEIPYSEIFFHHLRERGVHVYDGRPSFLTMVHGQEELARVVDGFKSSVFEMQEGGFYPPSVTQVRADAPPVPGARLGRDAKGNPAWFVPDPANPSRYTQIARA